MANDNFLLARRRPPMEFENFSLSLCDSNFRGSAARNARQTLSRYVADNEKVSRAIIKARGNNNHNGVRPTQTFHFRNQYSAVVTRWRIIKIHANFLAIIFRLREIGRKSTGLSHSS